jgi:hypothetical protein
MTHEILNISVGNWKIPRNKQKWIHIIPIHLWENDSGSKRDIYSYKCLHYNLECLQISNLMLQSSILEKQEEANLKISV